MHEFSIHQNFVVQIKFCSSDKILQVVHDKFAAQTYPPKFCSFTTNAKFQVETNPQNLFSLYTYLPSFSIFDFILSLIVNDFSNKFCQLRYFHQDFKVVFKYLLPNFIVWVSPPSRYYSLKYLKPLNQMHFHQVLLAQTSPARFGSSGISTTIFQFRYIH